jgi:hypothetical protein
MLQERERTHPNMVSVQDRSQERSSINLLKVDIGWVDSGPASFSWPDCVSEFSPRLSRARGKKKFEAKKVWKQVAQKGLDL